MCDPIETELAKLSSNLWLCVRTAHTTSVNRESLRPGSRARRALESLAVFIIFPKLETRFNTHYQNA